MAQEMAERILFALHIQRLFRLIGKKRLHSLLCNDCLLQWDRVIGSANGPGWVINLGLIQVDIVCEKKRDACSTHLRWNSG